MNEHIALGPERVLEKFEGFKRQYIQEKFQHPNADHAGLNEGLEDLATILVKKFGVQLSEEDTETFVLEL